MLFLYQLWPAIWNCSREKAQCDSIVTQALSPYDAVIEGEFNIWELFFKQQAHIKYMI